VLGREPKSLLDETTVEPITSSARGLEMLEGRCRGDPRFRITGLDVLVADWWYGMISAANLVDLTGDGREKEDPLGREWEGRLQSTCRNHKSR